MRKTRLTDEQVVAILREADAQHDSQRIRGSLALPAGSAPGRLSRT
jgi:hypothetical protein